MTSNMSQQIFCTGLSYKESSISLREQLSFTSEEVTRLLRFLSQKDFIQEILVLSTCNRFEVYGVVEERFSFNSHEFKRIWEEIFLVKPSLEASKLTLKKKVYSYSSHSAVRHAFKVFTSLDSLCIGETQITGQFKKSLHIAQKQGTSGPILKRLCHDAIALNKKIRNQTLLGRNEKSIGQMAIELSLHIFSSIRNKSIVLIGAGKMVHLAFKHALCYELGSITVVNRTVGKAKEIVRDRKNCYATSLDKLEESLLDADIVLASTAAQNFIITADHLRKIQKKRKNKPLFLIDIALPRDIDPKASDIEEVYLFDLDDIRKVIKIKNDHQIAEIRKAEAMIEERSSLFEDWVAQNIEVEPVLSDLGSYLKDLISREEERTLGKAVFKDLSLNQKDALKKMLQSISQKILSDTARSMKERNTTLFAVSPASTNDKKTG